MISHVASMKADIIELKETIQRLVPCDQNAGELENLKLEITKLKTENTEIIDKIKIVQKELKRNKEDESVVEKTATTELVGSSLCNYCSYQCSTKEEYKNHIKTHQKKDSAEGFKCDKCDFKCDTVNTLIKHVNTRHPSGNELKEDLNICPNCMKKFKTRIILWKHFHENHMDKEPDLYHQNLDKLMDMYEANLVDSDDDDSDSNTV